MIVNSKSIPVHHWEHSLWYVRTFSSEMLPSERPGYEYMATWLDHGGCESMLFVTYGMERDLLRAGLDISAIKGQTVRMRKQYLKTTQGGPLQSFFQVEICQ